MMRVIISGPNGKTEVDAEYVKIVGSWLRIQRDNEPTATFFTFLIHSA